MIAIKTKVRISAAVLVVWLLTAIVSTNGPGYAASKVQDRPDRPHSPPRYPWHFVNIWWTSASPTESFNEISVDFRIVGEVPDSVDLYIAPLGLARIGRTPLYGGVQTSTRGWPSKNHREVVVIGRGGIFSRWSSDNQKIPVELASGPPGTHFESADYEDNFISVRRKADWSSGSYTYLVRRARSQPTDAAFVWFTAYVRDNSTGSETEIGSLRFEGPDYSLGNAMAAFVEVYGETSPIPRVTIAFSEPRVNGVHRPSTAVRVFYPQNGTTSHLRFATARKRKSEILVSLEPKGVAYKPEERFRD